MTGTLLLPDHPLDGARVESVRRSGATGSWTVKLLAPTGAYRLGCAVVVKAGEIAWDRDLVVGQCAVCHAINRHEPSCRVSPGTFQNWLD